MRVACAWSRVVKEGGVPKGGVILVQTRLEEATRLRATMQRPADIISESAPKSMMFGGSNEAIDEFVALLDSRGVASQRLPFPFAFHVPLLESGKADFQRGLSGLAGRRPTIPVYSMASGGLLRDARFDAQHWYGVFCEPALVAGATRAILQDGYNRFLSISLTSSVMFPIRYMALGLGKEVVVSSSLPYLADGEMPFQQPRLRRIAWICRRLKRRLWPARAGK